MGDDYSFLPWAQGLLLVVSVIFVENGLEYDLQSVVVHNLGTDDVFKILDIPARFRADSVLSSKLE